jgi:alkylhydroperoxidase/carboxymuconolactone decarboxylase family protein YurZ
MSSGIKALFDHFEESLGVVPDPIRDMAALGDKWADAYLSTRTALLEPREGGLDFGTQSLIFSLLDVVAGNLPGAVHHGRRALQNGIEPAAMMQGLMQVFLVFGVQSWGITGHRLVSELDLVPNIED